MNFLAHMDLSFMDEEVLVGNFLADFISNKRVKSLPSRVVHGVMLHRFIDSFTDLHPAVKSCTEMLRPTQHKYAPVVVDVIFDYILSNDWEMYTAIPFRELKTFAYRALLDNLEVMPIEVQERTKSMVQGDFLMVYGTEVGLRNTFKRLSHRTTFPDHLDIAVDDMLEHLEVFKQAFTVFYPELKAEAYRFYKGEIEL